MLKSLIIFVILIACELVYFKIAEKFNIIDEPNNRSSHVNVVLRGGGIIFLIGLWLWAIFFGPLYPWLLVAVTLVAGISFVDDVNPLPDGIRLITQFVAMLVMFYQVDILHLDMWWMVILALIICTGASNIYNFMDGINGITAGYSFAVLFSLLLLNQKTPFVAESLIVVTILSTLVFAYFNFRPKDKAKCFAGDVGSIGIAYILLFILGCLIVKTGDGTWLTFLIVYGVDGCLTICHRIKLHENLGKAHRKHMYQIMSNELGMNHVVVASIYTIVQLVISMVMICLIPNTALAHWVYLVAVFCALSVVYLLFMKKYYHLHEEYLASLEKSND